MGKLFSRANLRDLSLILAFAMLLAALPSFGPSLIVLPSGQPECAVDICHICHPVQIFDRAPDAMLARPSVGLPEFALRDLGATAPKQAPRLVEFKTAPDTPPPKTLA